MSDVDLPASPDPEDEDGDVDEHALMERLPWEGGRGRRDRDGTGRGSTREGRSRSRSREQRTWSSASASGWRSATGESPAGSDGNEHRPWRRMPRPSPRTGRSADGGGRSTGGTDGGGRSAGGNHSSALATAMGPQAWHCLLDMRSLLEPPSQWGYGLPLFARTNVEESYLSTTAQERQVMSIERSSGWCPPSLPASLRR